MRRWQSVCSWMSVIARMVILEVMNGLHCLNSEAQGQKPCGREQHLYIPWQCARMGASKARTTRHVLPPSIAWRPSYGVDGRSRRRCAVQRWRLHTCLQT
ncbi:hypothetical protein EV401DRAFT_1548929 [Pisolithus croceorrhizus]|nr:hypothetical protein EV401DRAFT_1548929 [Pisolithus croceorrhizus]